MARVKHPEGPFQLLVVVRHAVERTYNGATVACAITSQVLSFDTKPAANIAFANVSENCNARGEWTVTKLYEDIR